VVALDNGGLQSQVTSLTVNVNRNRFTPEFLNLPRTLNQRSDVSTTATIFTCQSRDNDTGGVRLQTFLLGHTMCTICIYYNNHLFSLSNYFFFLLHYM
jgi:hypothetical protein